MTALSEVLSYAARGIPILPIFPIRDGACSCSEGRSCKRPGKHPLAYLVPEGLKNATTDAGLLAAWWTAWPDANAAARLGPGVGVVLDVDPRHNGHVSLSELLTANGPLPEGPTVDTGGDGVHYWFAHPGGSAATAHGFLPGLDFQGDGAYVLLPPSNHLSGGTYRWRIPPDTASLPLVPPWLFAAASAHKTAPGPSFTTTPQGKVPHGQRHDWIVSTAASLASRLGGIGEDRLFGMVRAAVDQAMDTDTNTDSVIRDAARSAILKFGRPAPIAPPAPPEAPGVPSEIREEWSMESAGAAFVPPLWVTNKSGEDAPSRAGFASAVSSIPGRRFVTRTDNDELLLYHPRGPWRGMYNGHAHAFVGTWHEARFLEKGKTSTKSFHSELEGSIRRRTYTDPATFNPPGRVCLLNGILSLDKKQLDPHTPDTVFTWKLPVAFDPSARCDRFDRFLAEVMPDPQKAELLIDLIGYCLWRENPFQNFFVIVGDGANGKTRFINVIEDLLGPEAVSTESLQTISSQRFGPAQLEGKLANICDDLPHNQMLSGTGILKTLTGGGTIRAEKKGKDPFKFRFGGKLISTANRLPEVDDDTYAFRRRPITITFRVTFPEEARDPNLREALSQELPGILNRALEGYARVRRRQKFDPDGRFDDGASEWARRSDAIREFLETTRVLGREYETRTEELYADYKEWCGAESRKVIGETAFGKRVSMALPLSLTEQRKVGKHRWYVRIGVGPRKSGLGLPESPTLDGNDPPLPPPESGQPKAGDLPSAGSGSGLGQPWAPSTGETLENHGSRASIT
ncbi:MAG: phage/plasmid primase, P4 family, partial [Thermoplasmata archaeon]